MEIENYLTSFNLIYFFLILFFIILIFYFQINKIFQIKKEQKEEKEKKEKKENEINNNILNNLTNKKLNNKIENIASAQAQRIASKMTPEIRKSSDFKNQNELYTTSPYSALIDSLTSNNNNNNHNNNNNILLTPKLSDERDDSSTSSNSSEELSESSNRKRSDLHRFTFYPKSSSITSSTYSTPNKNDNKLISPTRLVHSTLTSSTSPTNTTSKSSGLHSPPNQSYYDQILQSSVKKPEILIGWKIEVPEYGRGIILDYEKKKFRSTKYRILFDNQQEKLLKLKRSEKKGKIPFILLEISGK